MNQVPEQQIAEIKNFNQLKEDFLSTISHELRSPMTNIKMATKMLKLLLQQYESNGDNETQFFAQRERSILNTKASRYLQILEHECDREMSLLNNFLDLQQLDAGNYCLNRNRVNLQELLPLAVKPFLNRIAILQQTLHLEIETNLPVLVIDKVSLERILTELLSNACKFTPVGEVIVVKLSLELRPTKVLKIFQLKVTNSGVEIPESECPQIFERFYRIPNHDRWKYDGTGLGLTLVKKLTEHLGGSIQVESGAGKTCFTVEIPVDG